MTRTGPLSPVVGVIAVLKCCVRRRQRPLGVMMVFRLLSKRLGSATNVVRTIYVIRFLNAVRFSSMLLILVLVWLFEWPFVSNLTSFFSGFFQSLVVVVVSVGPRT